MKKMRNMRGAFLLVILCMVPLPLPAVDSIHPGGGRFVFHDSTPGVNKTIPVYYYIPRGSDASTPVVFLMHGTTRKAQSQWRAFLDEAMKYNFILLAPQFGYDQYSSMEYHLGNIMSTRGQIVPRQQWTYSSIERIFDYVKASTGNRSERYYILGHSAGGQFVHRMVMAYPEARIEKAFASNAGFYTFPDETLYYPYGLKLTHITETSLRQTYAVDLTILLGMNDTATTGQYVPQSEEALAQGAHRYARGKNYFVQSKALARRSGSSYNWKKIEVPDVGHSSSGTYAVVFPELFKGRDVQRLYNDRKTETGTGRFLYTDSDTGKKVPVWYYRPWSDTPLPVIMVIHSGKRDGKEYRDRMIYVAEQYQCMVLSPEFSADEFSGIQFNHGNVFERYRRTMNSNEETWTYSMIDRIYAEAMDRSGWNHDGYYLYGNTGSARFPMRTILYRSSPLMKGVALANLLEYIAPDESTRYPYGLKDSGITNGQLAKAYATPILVLAGEDGKTFVPPWGESSQGRTLYNRSERFFSEHWQRSKKMGVPFKWEFLPVPGTKWSYRVMLEAALKEWGMNPRYSE